MSTKIMGQAQASIEQMRAYIKKVNPKVPEPVIKMIPYYITEGALEGVRGDVAFAQSCLETGNFTFKGSAVTLDQNNFCGMGVTSNGVRGNSFKTPKEGIRAQIQHLKAYACNDALEQRCIDPRFTYVKRGCAPYVEWLGIQENPSGAGWASGKGYGNKILNILSNILKTGEREETMNIIKMLTKKNCYPGQNKPAYVVIHETDNWSKGADAKAHATAMKNGNLAGTVHYYVDSKSVYQTLAHEDGAWAVGDGKGKYGITNRNSINIEICVNPETDYYKAVDKAEQLAAFLLKQYGWGTDRLKRHYDASRKHCPRRIIDEDLWDKFKAKTKGYMGSSGNDEEPEKYYRIRKSWENEESQIGAYKSLDNAKKDWKEGYTIYDWNGKAVYPEKANTGNNKPTGGDYMFKPTAVKRGDKNTSVLLLQEILKARGFKGKDKKELKLDWEAGENTIHALKEYQKSRKGVLEVDGICGTNTWKDLIAI